MAVAKGRVVKILLQSSSEGWNMTMERLIRAISGTFVLVSLALGFFYSPYWFLFTAFVGLNLLQSAFTKWCLMEEILSKMGVKKTC
jgi:hypothetical protein